MRIFLMSISLLVIISALLAAGYTIITEKDKCVGCGDCEQVCPVNAVEVVNGKALVDTKKCIQCEICIKSCTYNAIRKEK